MRSPASHTVRMHARKAVSILSTVLALVFLNGPLQSEGRVFLRTGLAKDMIDPVQIGWREAFRGDLEIDGASVAAQVLSSRSGAKTTLKRIESFFESRGARFAGAGGARIAWGLAAWPDRAAHILLVSQPLKRGTLVFVYHRREDSRAPLKKPFAADLPVYPGAELSRSVARAESGLRMGFYETTASEGEVLDYYENTLPGNGWHAALQDSRGRALPRSFLIFLKDKRLCCISVKSSGVGRMNLITVLSKDID